MQRRLRNFLFKAITRNFPPKVSINSLENLCLCEAHHYPRALDKGGISLSTDPLVRRGEEPQEERDLGPNEHLGSLMERERVQETDYE